MHMFKLNVFPTSKGDESHKADEYIRFIKDRLPDAVVQCIKAASEEFDPPIQQSLLKVFAWVVNLRSKYIR